MTPAEISVKMLWLGVSVYMGMETLARFCVLSLALSKKEREQYTIEFVLFMFLTTVSMYMFTIVGG